MLEGHCRLLNEYAPSVNPSPSPNKFRLRSFATPPPSPPPPLAPDDSVLMLRANGKGERQIVEGGRNAPPPPPPPLLPVPLQEPASLPSQDSNSAGGALNPPPLPGGASEALPPSQLADALRPPPSGRFVPLHEFPGLSPSLSLPPAPAAASAAAAAAAPTPPSRPHAPASTLCFAGEGFRISRQWWRCPTIVRVDDDDADDDEGLGRGRGGCWCDEWCPFGVDGRTAGFSDSAGGERGRSAPSVFARLGLVPPDGNTSEPAATAAAAGAAAAAPAFAAVAFEGEVGWALLMTSAFSRARAWVPPASPFRE